MSMRDFVILSKIGKFHTEFFLLISLNIFIGDGAYSEVYKVKRLSDQ